jgi:signal transduction histidine kinase
MKKEYIIVLSAFFFGLFVWIFDSAADSLFFYEDSFLNLAIFKIPKPELFFRLQVLIFFTIFGMIISFFFAKQKKTKEYLLKLQNELEKRVEERTKKLSESNELLNVEIAERVHAEASLRRSQKMLKEIFDGISEPLVLLDRDMRVKIINKAAADYYGLSEDSVILESKCHQMLRDSAAPCQGCEVPTAISIGKGMQFERKGFMDPERLENVFIYPVNTGDGKNKNLLLRISDISEQRLLEKQIIHNEKMAALGLLVSSIAHEINNPNNFISLNIPVLKNYITEMLPILDTYYQEHPALEICNISYTDFREDIFKLLENVEHGSDRIGTFVSNLKDFSQFRAKIKEEWIDLNPVIEKAISICRGRLKERNKSFITYIPENLPQVWSDPFALEQILINLLINAIQAAENRDPMIELSVAVHSNWLHHIILEVKDNGCGMDEKTIQKIFNPFFTTKQSAKGTGLGLYVTQNLVASLRGRIEVESELTKGSIFRVILPDKEQRTIKRL